MFNNPIGVEGARVILQSAVNNEACQAIIVIDDEYRRDSEVQTLMKWKTGGGCGWLSCMMYDNCYYGNRVGGN